MVIVAIVDLTDENDAFGCQLRDERVERKGLI